MRRAQGTYNPPVPIKTYHLRYVALLVMALCVGCQAGAKPAAPTLAPLPTPTAVPPPAWQDRDTYRAAMLEAAADDVTRIEAPTFYQIEAYVDITAHPPRVYAIQNTHYSNSTETTLDSIFFRLFPNKPGYGTALTLERVTAEGEEVELHFQSEGTALGVALPNPLPPGQSVDLHMEYDVTVPVENARGYGTFNYQGDILLLSNFFAMVAVHEDDGWNLSLAPDYGDPVFAETSFFTVELTVPQDMVVVTSGTTVDRRDNIGETTTWTCISGPMRDFMVVASDRFVQSSTAVGHIRLNSYYLPGHQQAGEQVLAYARDSLRAYQQSFGLYPFAELDVVEAPIQSGVEYPGLVVLAEQHYEHSGELTEFLVAHEVAQQSCYSMVGNDQVNVPWLDESLSNFSTIYYYEHTYGQARAELAFENFVARSYRQAKEEGRDGVVLQPVAAFAPQDYGPIVYGKGAVFFYELREKLGDATLLDILQDYFEDRKYKLAVPGDLLRVAEIVSGQELDGFYTEWILSAE